MFGFPLFVKSFHWLASDHIELMHQRPYPGPLLLFHLRMSALFAILWLTDFIMFLVAVENTLSYGIGGMVPFVSEYGILMHLKHYCKVLVFVLRVKTSWPMRRRDYSAMGEQEYVGILY
ncbi:hypothetical protein L218DRAFT_1019423 [Marasmius fiardii PR-910]|nr:hypothetical protein L218DRAFT_1019423 [Marasmius fiardii PR-910]